MLTLYIFLGAIALIVLWGAYIYNRYVVLDNRSEEAWSDIDVQLKRRYDLIPNLINTVKGYAAHERQTFEKVTEMRANAMQPHGTAAEQAKAENMLTEALRSLFAVSENYPDLKANENFLDLQRELTDTENKIQAARRFYNGTIRDLQTFIESFPMNVMGGMFGFKSRDFFELEADSEEREPVAVSF